MAKILWGKPEITITNIASSGGSSALTVPTPVDGSTQLSTERGEKHEALIEGGANEAVRYDKGTHTLEFEVRFAAGRVMPLQDKSSDGVITGTYKVKVADPDDDAAPTMTINEATASYEDIYSSTDGARRHYYFDSIVPTTGSVTEQITWENIGTV